MEINESNKTESLANTPTINQPAQSITGNSKNLLPIIIGEIILLFIVAFGGYFIGKNTVKNNNISDINPQPTILQNSTNEQIDTPIPPQTSEIDENSGWKTFSSKVCDFSLNTPNTWTVSDTGGQNAVTNEYPCTSLVAPDYQQAGADSSVGLYMVILRIPIGSTIQNTNISTLDDYINAIKIPSSAVVVENVIDAKYGSYSGKSFVIQAFDKTENFIFIKGNNIFIIKWVADYQGTYKNDIQKVISSLTF